jgi:hypothetical protein
MPVTSKPNRKRLVLLALGATSGLILAATGLVDRWSPPSSQLPANAIARVGERVILKERYLELLSDLEADKRTPLNADDRLFVLNRLIDEELLIMRGIELGLHEISPQIRKTIAAAVIAQLAAEAEAATANEATLRQLYESDSEYFTTSARYHVRWWYLPGTGPETERKALAAYQQLSSSTPLEAVIPATGLERETMLPDELLPLNKLSDYMGLELVQQLSELEQGEYSRPVAVSGSFHILYLLTHQEGVLLPFEQARPMVEAEFLRRRGDDALRQHLAWLRERTEIIVIPEKTP